MAEPRLGYASTTAAVMALLDEDCDRRAIADRLGIRIGVLRTLETTRRHYDVAAELWAIERDGAILTGLREHAVRRGITRRELAGRLLETIVVNGLVDAVLDDADEPVEAADAA